MKICMLQDASFQGLYTQSKDCPSWAQGWDCQADSTAHRDKLEREYSEVAGSPEHKDLVHAPNLQNLFALN